MRIDSRKYGRSECHANLEYFELLMVQRPDLGNLCYGDNNINWFWQLVNSVITCAGICTINVLDEASVSEIGLIIWHVYKLIRIKKR